MAREAAGCAARFDDPVAGEAFELIGPRHDLVARRPDEVLDVLDGAEAAARAGSWVAGYVSYEAAPGLDPALPVREPVAGLPLAWFGVFSDRRRCPPPVGPTDVPPGSPAPVWSLGWTPERHRGAVAAVRDLILDGETYQVNLTIRAGSVVSDPAALYAALVGAQAGRYGCYLRTPTHAIACASPELFFEARHGRLRLRPMKGTAARADGALDRCLGDSLRVSEKERAENVMIVDLVRNDLGRIARPGSVVVERLFDLEAYPTVWQMTSTVTADVEPGVGLADMFRALFPCGSVTGAPKRRTMQAIADLEDEPRGVYCGAVGFVAPDGDGGGAVPAARFAVAIRTATVCLATGRADFGIGGGITWQSSPSAEWDEIVTKARILGPLGAVPIPAW